MQKRHALFFAIFLIIILYFSLLPTNTTLSSYYGPITIKDPPKIKLQKSSRPANQKTILFWNKYFRRADFYLGFGSSRFRHCEFKNCFLTNNKTYLPVDKFDAVVFHGIEYNESMYGKPEKRDPKQIYIFYNMEPPQKNPIHYKFLNNFYNWTMTYRKDSDIFRPHNYYIKHPSIYKAPTIEDILKKPKKIAWFVSNCRAFSHRNELVDELSNYIPVDIYGECGFLRCPKNKYILCYRMVERNYKFYLSLENSICTDYITEKTFNLLYRNIIPIVMGGANYSAVTPPHSVINIQDFKHINDLVAYLKFLDANPEEYLKYFEWKKSYKMRLGADLGLCQLCKKLNEEHETKVYSSIWDWLVYKNKTTRKRHCTSSFVDNFIS